MEIQYIACSLEKLLVTDIHNFQTPANCLVRKLVCETKLVRIDWKETEIEVTKFQTRVPVESRHLVSYAKEGFKRYHCAWGIIWFPRASTTDKIEQRGIRYFIIGTGYFVTPQ